MRTIYFGVCIFFVGLFSGYISNAQSKVCFDRPTINSLQKFPVQSSKQLLTNFGWTSGGNNENPISSYFNVSLNYSVSSWYSSYTSGRNLYLLSQTGKPNAVIYQTDRNCFYSLLSAFSSGRSIPPVTESNFIVTSFKINENTIEFREYKNDYSSKQYSVLLYNTIIFKKDILNEKKIISGPKLEDQVISTKSVMNDNKNDQIVESPVENNSSSIELSTENEKTNSTEKFSWEQIFNIDSANIKPANELNIDEYQKLQSEIKSISIDLENQYKKELDARPKDPFETTLDYQQRINIINNKYKKLATDQTIDLMVKLENWENYQFMSPSQIKVIFDLNKYNADKGQWEFKLYENNKTYNLSILIPPTEARQLWSNISTVKVYELTKVNAQQQLPILLITYQNQSSLLTIRKFSSTEEGEADGKVFTKVEVDATYAGGDAAWRRFLSNNLDSEVTGSNGAPAGSYTVIVRFIVAKDGSVSDVVAETNFGFGMEQESVRAIKKSGKWTPAIVNGRNVTAYKRQPISWVVQE